MYRLQLENGRTVECDTREELLDLLSALGGTGERRTSPLFSEKPEAPPPTGESISLQDRDKVMRFLRGMTSTSEQILRSLMAKPGQGPSKDELKKLLKTNDPKAVGGSIAGVNRKAIGCSLPRVIEFDKDEERYKLNPKFMDVYRGAGSPEVPSAGRSGD